MHSLFLVLFLGTLYVQSALLPTTPVSQNNETIVGCDRKVFSWDVTTNEPQFSLSVSVTAQSSSDITIYLTRDAPDDIHFQDDSCDLGVSCTATPGSPCQVTQDCSATGLWYIIVTTPSSVEETFSLDTTITPIGVITLPVGTKDEDLYDEAGIITGGLLSDGASDFFEIVLPTVTETQQLMVRVGSLSGTATLSAALNPTNIAGASCVAEHSSNNFVRADLVAPPCKVESGAKWYITVTRSQDDQQYQVKAWVEELARTITVNGDPLRIVHTGEMTYLVSISGIDQVPVDEDLFVSAENPINGKMTMVLTPKNLVPVCGDIVTADNICESDQGYCTLSVAPCERVTESTWNIFLANDFDDDYAASEWTIKAWSKKVEVEKKDDYSSVFGSLSSGERSVFSVAKPRGMNDWLEFDLYMTNYLKTSTAPYLALYVYKDDTICKNNVMKACSYRIHGNTVFSCTLQLDPCELDEFDGDRIYFSVVQTQYFDGVTNTVHDSQFTLDLTIRNPYNEPDRIQRGEVITDGLPVYQYANWPELTRTPLTRVYYVEPIPFGNFTFTFTPTSGNFLVQFFDIKDGQETKIGPSCACWGANSVVDSSGTSQRIYSVDNYYPWTTAEYARTFPHGLFIAVQPFSANFADYEYNLAYTVRASNPTFAGHFAEGVQYYIEGMVDDEYRYYELDFGRDDLSFKYMVLDLKTIPNYVDFALFRLSSSLLDAFKAGETKDFFTDALFEETLNINVNGEHVYVSDCLWDSEGDDLRWILFVYSNRDNAQFNVKFDVKRANPVRLVPGEAINNDLHRNEYHYFEVDVPQSAIDENKQLIVEVYFDQRHPQSNGALPLSFFLYHRGPAEYTVLTGTGDCRCNDDSVSHSRNVAWIGRLCDMEAGIHTFSVRLPQQNPIPYKPKYTIKAKFVDLYQGELALGVPTSGELFNGQVAHYSFTPPASLFDANNADSKLTLTVFSPSTQQVTAVVMEQNNSCSCPGTIFQSQTGYYLNFEWTYCTTTASTYYLAVTAITTADHFPTTFTVLMQSDVRHPEVIPLTLVDCSVEEPEETFVYNGQYRQYSLNIPASTSFRVEFTDVIDGSLQLFRNDDDVAVSGCGQYINDFDGDYNFDQCTTEASSFHLGVYGQSNYKYDAVRYRIRACEVVAAPTFQPLATPATGTLLEGETVRIYYNLPATLSSTLGNLYVEASFNQTLQYTFRGEPKVCVGCPVYTVDTILTAAYSNFASTCAFPENMASYNWYIELENTNAEDVTYNVTVSLFQATVAPITLVNKAETIVTVPARGWAIYRYTPVTYDATQVDRRVTTSITAQTTTFNTYSRTSSESCATSSVASRYCCASVIDIIFFNPTTNSHTANLTVNDYVYMHYNTLNYPAEGAIVTVTVPAVVDAALAEYHTYKLNYPVPRNLDAILTYNFSASTYVSYYGPYFSSTAGSCRSFQNQWSAIGADFVSDTSILDSAVPVYLTIQATATATDATIQFKQVAPKRLTVGESWIGTLSEPTPVHFDLSTFSRSTTRTVVFDVSADSTITVSIQGGGSFNGVNPAVPAISGCTTEQLRIFTITAPSYPVTLNFSTSYQESTDPNLIFIPTGESRSRVYPGAPTTWTFETSVPDASQLTETSTLVFSIVTPNALSVSGVNVGLGCAPDVQPTGTFICLPTKDGENQCTFSISRSDLRPSSFVVVRVDDIDADYTASFKLLNPTLNIITDETKAYSVSIGEVLYFRWASSPSVSSVEFVSNDECGSVRFFETGGDALPSFSTMPRLLDSTSTLDSLSRERTLCDDDGFYTFAAVLFTARNAETSIGFTVYTEKLVDSPEVRTIFVNELHTLMGRRVADAPAPPSTCPNPYVPSSISSEKCDCPAVATNYAADNVVYQLILDGFYAWDRSTVVVKPSEYVTGVSTTYLNNPCGAPISVTPITFTRQVFFTISPNGFSVPADADEEFPIATISTSTIRRGKIPVAFSEEPQYILFTLAAGESQHFEIIHDESGRLDYAPSFRVIAVVNGSVGFNTLPTQTSFASTTPSPRCLDRIAYPDCPSTVTDCNVGVSWSGVNYNTNLYNRTYVRIGANSIATGSHVVRGVVEVRFLRPYSMVDFAEDFCYEIEPDHTHVMLFTVNASETGRMRIHTNNDVRFTMTPATDTQTYIRTSGCTSASTCTYSGSDEYYLQVRNFGTVSNAYYQLSWEPELEEPTTSGTLTTGENNFGYSETCVVDRPIYWVYTKTDPDSILLARWFPIEGSTSLTLPSGSSNTGTAFFVICEARDEYRFTVPSSVRKAQLYIYEVPTTTDIIKLTVDADPIKIPLPAPGGTILFEVDYDSDDFGLAFERSIRVDLLRLDNGAAVSVFSNAIGGEFKPQWRTCSVVPGNLPLSYGIRGCHGDRRIYYVHVPETEPCSGGATFMARARWQGVPEEYNPTGTDVTFVPMASTVLPFKALTTVDNYDYIHFRVSNVRGTTETPALRVHFRRLGCCVEYQQDVVSSALINQCNDGISCTGEVSIYAVLVDDLTLLPGFTHVTLDLEVVRVPKYLLPSDGTEISVTLDDPSNEYAVIQAPLSPYAGFSYVFNITSGSYPLSLTATYQCSGGADTTHNIICLPGAPCQLSVPQAYHLSTQSHGTLQTHVHIMVRGKSTEFTARLAVTPAQVCSTVDATTAPFCSAVLTGEQWSISANHPEVDRSAEQLFDQLVDDFSCKSFNGVDCTCPGKLSQACEDALKNFACHQSFLECNADGFGQTTSYTVCSDVERFCGKSFLDAVPNGGYAVYDCRHNHYSGGVLFVDGPVPDYEKRPVPFSSASTIFSFFTLALILALLAL